eukprot:TRINITY_DN3265_c0_g1_i1.p1 TRINITY_DN3265_c0_g1~~TRINITY_DN3265_c0_g1_i1.p1  ORF type:complete len:404 (+),score=102.96 TRINITY_DN3265_c0_g1_i1:57-1268(+)
MGDVYIVEAVRTPIARGYKNGKFHNLFAVELLSQTLDSVVSRAGVPKAQVEDVIVGCVCPVGEQGGNIARMALLKAGFPIAVAGVQLNRMCGSGQQAIHFAAQAIAAGDMDCVVACGVESMSRVPMGSDSPWTEGPLVTKANADAYRALFPGLNILHQGKSAEMIAEKWRLTRDELDRFSGQSHEKAGRAMKLGFFKREILPVETRQADGSRGPTVADDEGVRLPVDYAKMASLPTPFNKAGGKISAANASQISDGASAVMLCSERKMKELGLRPRARIVARVVVGSDPELMLTGPIPATQKVLQKAGLRLSDIDVFEINEAFASVVLAWQKELGVDPSKVNPNGGAIAHGHPLGATGCILMTKLVHELERSGARYGLQTMCIGYGQATATIIENVSSPRAKL